MSQLLWRVFEWFGGWRIYRPSWSVRVSVGDPNTPDAMASTHWRNYLSAEALFDAWSPHEHSPWLPFHTVTLFAGLDTIARDRLGPAPPGWYAAGPVDRLERPDWAGPQAMVIIDLPDRQSPAVAARLCQQAGYQPVVTYNNWPHQAGVVKPEIALAALLRYASTIEAAKRFLDASAPPALVCDRKRLGTSQPKPGDFDNRYYLEEAQLPGPTLLKSHGIEQVIYIAETPGQMELGDLSAYFQLLIKQGFTLLRTAYTPEGTWSPPEPFQPRDKPFAITGFHTTLAGGFGSKVPDNSGGGG